jgi:hypothetical protein
VFKKKIKRKKRLKNDSNKFFAKLVVDSNIGENNYFGIVKTPLDFATIMEKINEGICFIIEPFLFNVYLMCCNTHYV